jgi:hypothetical protein
VKVWIKPAEGMRIRMPGRKRKFLPEGGALAEQDDFVRRLIADKDVVKCEPPKQGEAAPPADDDAAPQPGHEQEKAS